MPATDDTGGAEMPSAAAASAAHPHGPDASGAGVAPPLLDPLVPPPRGAATELFELAAAAACASAACWRCLASSAACRGLGPALALWSIARAEIGLRRRQFLSVLTLELLRFGELGVERVDQVGDLFLFVAEGGLLLGEVLGQRQHLVGAACAVVEGQAAQRILLLGLAVRGSVREERAEIERTSGDVLVDGDVAEHAGELIEAGLLLSDLGLRIGDLLIELILAILGRVVVLVELAEAILEVIELSGGLVDLLLLRTDAVGVDDRRSQQTSDSDRGRDNSKLDAPGPHAGRSLPIITNLCRSTARIGRRRDRSVHSHSMVPGGFDVMS
jgi:hypothetical protein